jgi:hypothetical protein
LGEKYVSFIEVIMTAEQIIEDIKLLPWDEQSRVVRFAVELARSRQLPAEDLVVIAQRMLDARMPRRKCGWKMN